MSGKVESSVVIERRQLNTFPQARLNSYNHHSLAPWLEKTGYLTPLYFHHRERALLPFNMACWLSPNIQRYMLAPPAAILRLTDKHVVVLLEIAAEVDYNQRKARANARLRSLAEKVEARSDTPTVLSSARGRSAGGAEGFFIRMSQCSPKDTDDGNLQPVYSIFDAFVKLVSSKRTVKSLLDLHYQAVAKTLNPATAPVVENQVYFFPYYSALDRLSEWRCYVQRGKIVAISQSRFYHPNHAGITDDALRQLVSKAKRLWDTIADELIFDSCALDLYAEVRNPNFQVRLIEINPWGAHLGLGSLLFHWLDDAAILEPCERKLSSPTVVRIVEHMPARELTRDQAYQIGRKHVIRDEMMCLIQRGLTWILEPQHHRRFMALEVPDGLPKAVTRRESLASFGPQKLVAIGDDERAVGDGRGGANDHPRYLRVKTAYLADLNKSKAYLRDQPLEIAQLNLS